MNASEWYRKGLDTGREHCLPRGLPLPHVAGMGGSGIAGAVLARLRRRLLFARGGYPPRAGIYHKLVLVSYSGNTVETLAWLARAGTFHRRWGGEYTETRATAARVVTTGGRLAQEARRRNIPVVEVTHPGPPRRALYELLGIIEGIVIGPARQPLWDGSGPPAGEVAQAEAVAADWASRGLLPWVFAGQRDDALMRRWAGQLQEDAKVPAGGGTLPEAAHNQLEALGNSPHPVGAIILPGGPEGLDRRIAKVLGDRDVPTYLPADIGTVGLCILADAFALAWAAKRGVEADPIPTITALKGG